MQLPGYKGSAAVIVNGNTVKVQKDEQAVAFPLQHSGNTITLANPQDSTAIYELLQVTPEQMSQALSDNAGSTTMGKLLDIASKMRDGKLILSQTGTEPGMNDTIEEEGAQPAVAVTDTESDYSKWLWPLIAAVAALIIGIIAGKMTKKAAPVEHNTDSTPKVPAADTAALQQLRQELAEAKEKNRVITEKTQALISGDELYYNQVFQKIVLPLQEAINQGNSAEMTRQLHIAATHLSSITRTKIRKKLNYDDANIQLITGNPTFTNEFPAIDAQTPIDKIPANIRNLIQVLKQNGVSGLDDSIVQGYKLKHI